MGLFYYTLGVLLVIAVAASMCLSVFVLTRRRIALVSALGFVFAFFDVALTFRTDFVGAGRSSHVRGVFDINAPGESIILGAMMTTVLWMIMLSRLRIDYRFALVPAAGIGVLSPLALLIEDPRWREFAFFAVRDAMILGIFAIAGIVFLRTRDPAERLRLRQGRLLWAVGALLTLATIAWNVWFQLLAPYPADGLETLPFLPERNFAENALVMWLAVQAVAIAWRIVRLRFEQAPRLSDADAREEFVRTSAERYGERFGLSAREREVLFHLVGGKDNREIAEALFLAVSTVKVHIHHILAKTSRANRVELTRDFWSHV